VENWKDIRKRIRGKCF